MNVSPLIAPTMEVCEHDWKPLFQLDGIGEGIWVMVIPDGDVKFWDKCEKCRMVRGL